MKPHDTGVRAQVGIGTLAVFIAMVLVAVIAGGVLLETTGFLQGESVETGQESSNRITDRVGVESATASYSSGDMQSIDIALSKAPGSGDIDLSSTVVHWLGPNGSSELTDSTFSITPIKGSGTVLEERADRMELSNFGKTIPDGTPTTVRFITAGGGTTTVILRTPNAPPSDGDVSLLWKSPTGNPASAAGTATPTPASSPTPTPTQTPTPTPTPSQPALTQKWTYDSSTVDQVAAEGGTSLYTAVSSNTGHQLLQLDASTGSVSLKSDQTNNFGHSLGIDYNDDPVWYDGSVYRWGTSENTISEVFDPNVETAELRPYSGDFYLGLYNQQGTRKYDLGGSELWRDDGTNTKAIDTTSTAVYAGFGADLIKYDHDGTLQWRFTDPEEVLDVETGPDSHIYAADNFGSLYQVDASDGSSSHITEIASDDSNIDVDTDADGYIYITDQNSVNVHDPTDGSLVLSKDLGATVTDIEARSDGIYIVAGNDLYKYSKSGF